MAYPISLNRKLRGVMDSQYHGRDGIMDEVRHEKDSSQGRPLSVEGPYVKPSPRRNKEMLMIDDLTSLPSLNDELILSHLLERFLGHQIYTYIGDILIAVNPLQSLNIYDKEHTKAYRNVEKSSLPPHIFMVADMTHRAMMHNKTPQCCLISGESGAGKTVSANYLVQQLAELGKGGNKPLEEKILQVNPLMEALGNARTAINNNSSRFGKYLELHFTPNGSLIGASLTEYLLEKSRVVFQSSGERNFHIFYYMIAGLAHQKKLEKYSFKLYSQHSYLQTGGKNLQDVVCTMGNKKRFEEVQRCLDVIGFSSEEVSSMFSVLAAVIHIGDIVFTEDESVSHLSDKSMVNNPQMLVVVSSLLGINAVELRDALTTNSNVTRGETIIRNNTVDQAVDCRDAMAKALYGRLFSWIVKRINVLLRFHSDPVSKDSDFKIGILDIFGFENFKINSFEQLCINIANEQIQFYFNQQIFSWELEEYRIEGVTLTDIKFEDNRPVLDMFLQKPIGILALLDEESRFPRASDFTLIEKFNSNIKCPAYQRPKEKENFAFFTVLHYAGKVKYNATNFLEKNRDTLSPDVVHVLRTSDNKLVRTLIQHEAKKDVNNLRNSKKYLSSESVSLVGSGYDSGKSNSSSTSRLNQTVSMHFRSSLKDLLSKLLPSQSHFVRCIRPNDHMVPGRFDQEKVMMQLKYTGVLETTRIRKQGYSERPTFEEFVTRYKVIGYAINREVNSSASTCKVILKAAKLDNWLLGRTKVFLKYYHVEALGKLLEDYRIRVVIAQSVIRSWLARRRFARLKTTRNNAALEIQSVFRGHLARRAYRAEKTRREEQALILQRVYEKKMRKVKNEQAIKIQAAARGYLVRKNIKQRDQERVERERQVVQGERNRAAVIIQSNYRGHHTRKNVSEPNKEYADTADIKTIFFLQQVIDSSNEFSNQQKGHANSLGPFEKKMRANSETKTTYADVVRRPMQASNSQSNVKSSLVGSQDVNAANLDMDELAAQQETKRIYLVQQIENSLTDFVDRLNSDLDESPRLERRHYKPSQIGTLVLPYTEVKPLDRWRQITSSHFATKPDEMRISELSMKASQRSQRSFRKEIWSASDEAYQRNFADDNKQEIYQKDQTKRVNEMLSIVEGLPFDVMRDPVWLGGPNKAKPNPRTFRPNRSPSPPPTRDLEGKTSENVFAVKLRAVQPFEANKDRPVSPPYNTLKERLISPPYKPIEERHISSPPRQERTIANQFVPHRLVSPPYAPQQQTIPHQTPRSTAPIQQPFERPVLRKVDRNQPVEHVSSQQTQSFEYPTPTPIVVNLTEPPRVVPAPPEPPKKIVIKKQTSRPPSLPSTPEPERVELRHTRPNVNETPPSNDLYSHVLRKTGQRTKLLGLTDEDKDSSVTRVEFNVPLKVSS